MSHVHKCKARINSLEALQLAVSRMGLFWHTQDTYNWWGVSVGDYRLPAGYKASELGKCEFVISITPQTLKQRTGRDYDRSLPYEVGVVRAKDGKGYELLYDFFGGGRGLVDAIGDKEGHRLVANYEACRLELEAIAQGYSVETWTDKNGTIVVEATAQEAW